MKIFTPFNLGGQILDNRIVMCPLTRNRAPGNIPNSMMAEYYSQRAKAGLLITEGTSPSPNGLGYPRIPGVFSKEQVEGWKLVTDAVHSRGGKIFLQIMHTGRVSHLDNMPEGAGVLGVSAIPVSGTVWTDTRGMQPYPVPKEMSADEVEFTIAEYASAASNAIRAGFNGVELHGANGYLIEQFLNPHANQRSDSYGGSGENRNRFALETAKAVIGAIGRERAGIRLSPYGVFNDTGAFEGIEEQFATLAGELGKLGLAYIHLVDHSSNGAPKPKASTVELIRKNFREGGGGALILSGGYDLLRAETDIQSGNADLIAFGRPFIANPDLVDRLRKGLPLAVPDSATYYTPGPEGYVDYPTFS